VILALLLFCALRRAELASLDVGGIQMREGRWVLPDLRGKGGRVRTVAIPIWVKHGIEAWMVAAKIEDGRLLRPLSKSGKLIGDEPGDWVGLVGRRAICEGDWNRALRGTRSAPDVREALPQERRRSGADQISPWTQLYSDDGAISWFGAGPGCCCKR
jgi:integrase